MHTRNYPVPAVETPDFLLAALERANDAVVIVDSDLRVSHFNAAAERIWGQDRAEVLGRHVSRLGLGDLQQHQVATPASDQLNGGDAHSLKRRRSEITIAAQGRQPDPCRAVAFARRGRRSKPHHRIRSGHHRRGRTTRKDWRCSPWSPTEPTARLSSPIRNLRIVYTNAAFTGMFGYSVEEAKGRQANELLVGRHTDRRTLARLRRWIDDEARRRGRNPQLRQKRRRDLDLGQRQGVPQRARAGQDTCSPC